MDEFSVGELRAMFTGTPARDVVAARSRPLAELCAEFERIRDRQRHPTAALAARRRAGRAALELGWARNGVPRDAVRPAIYASALPWLYGDD